MNKSLKNTRNLTFLGLMLAITVILDVSPLGAIPLGAISATITHIPTIITGVILGPIAGLIMGTLLGFVSLIHALTRPLTPFDPLFINPLVSVLPRMFIGVASYYTFTAVSKFAKRPAGAVVAGIAGSLTNTVLVFLMLYIVYVKLWPVVELASAFKAILIAVFTTNAIAEAIVSAILTVAVVMSYFDYTHRSEKIE